MLENHFQMCSRSFSKRKKSTLENWVSFLSLNGFSARVSQFFSFVVSQHLFGVLSGKNLLTYF